MVRLDFLFFLSFDRLKDRAHTPASCYTVRRVSLAFGRSLLLLQLFSAAVFPADTPLVFQKGGDHDRDAPLQGVET